MQARLTCAMGRIILDTPNDCTNTEITLTASNSPAAVCTHFGDDVQHLPSPPTISPNVGVRFTITPITNKRRGVHRRCLDRHRTRPPCRRDATRTSSRTTVRQPGTRRNRSAGQDDDLPRHQRSHHPPDQLHERGSATGRCPPRRRTAATDTGYQRHAGKPPTTDHLAHGRLRTWTRRSAPRLVIRPYLTSSGLPTTTRCQQRQRRRRFISSASSPARHLCAGANWLLRRWRWLSSLQPFGRRPSSVWYR